MFSVWLSSMVIVTTLCLLVYITAQQILRQGANDPQIQLAEDAAGLLAAGATPEHVLPLNGIDIAKSLSPFVVVYDESGAPLSSSGMLDGQTPTPPMGVFDTASWHAPIVGHHLALGVPQNESRFTWQTGGGVRIAAVLVQTQGPHPIFVLAGRSLREVEIREGNLGAIVGMAWLAVAGFLTLLYGALLWKLKFS